MELNRVVAFDTSIISENGGDNVIMDYCNNIMENIFTDSFIVHVPTHERIGKNGKKYCKEAKYKLLCGTNILASKLPKFRIWEAGLRDIKYISDVCLFGVGWMEYQDNPNIYSKYFWRKVLSKSLIHSVRDSYTEKKLNDLGFDNVVNTGCPTMWNLSLEHCKNIPQTKKEYVVTTLTDYRKNSINDKKMLDILFENYRKVYIWIQALEDYYYLKEIYDIEKLNIVKPGLNNLDRILSKDDIEYCGTRLHAGIRALNYGKRTTIIAKDNRAIEIGKDTGLNVLNDIDEMEKLLNSNIVTEIELPWENIKKWKNQFK